MTRQGPFNHVILGAGDRRAGYSGFQRSRRSSHSR
jgi:hypothetical protein